MVAPSPCYWKTSNSSHSVLGCVLSSPKESKRHCAETKTLSDDRTSSTRGVSSFSAPWVISHGRINSNLGATKMAEIKVHRTINKDG